MAVRTAASSVGSKAAYWVVLLAVRWGSASALASASSEQQSHQWERVSAVKKAVPLELTVLT
jgi:hypothetical protein